MKQTEQQLVFRTFSLFVEQCAPTASLEFFGDMSGKIHFGNGDKLDFASLKDCLRKLSGLVFTEQEDREAMGAVSDIAYLACRFPLSDVNLSQEDKERVVLSYDGSIEILLKNVHIREKHLGIYSIAVTVFFRVHHGKPIEGSTDIYECRLEEDGWRVDWMREENEDEDIHQEN